jgi:hypothetical protein
MKGAACPRSILSSREYDDFVEGTPRDAELRGGGSARRWARTSREVGDRSVRPAIHDRGASGTGGSNLQAPFGEVTRPCRWTCPGGRSHPSWAGIRREFAGTTTKSSLGGPWAGRSRQPPPSQAASQHPVENPNEPRLRTGRPALSPCPSRSPHRRAKSCDRRRTPFGASGDWIGSGVLFLGARSATRFELTDENRGRASP